MAANLHVRNVDEEVVRALKRRASEKGVSAEAEHRAILKQALLPPAVFDWEARAAALAKKLRSKVTLRSEDLIREDRDSR